MDDLQDLLLPGQLPDFEHVLNENGGFDIGGRDGLALIAFRLRHHFFGRKIVVKGFIRACLRNLPILAELAFQIAAGGGKGKGKARWEHMIEGLFLNGVNMHRTRVAINKRIILTIDVFTHPAVPALPFFHLTQARAELAPDSPHPTP